jgi:hypothetical protein
MRSFINYTIHKILYYYNDQVKDDEMGRACSMNGRIERNSNRVSVRKSEETRPLKRARRRREDNITTDLRQI